jgi:hypothetical protein
MVSNQTGLVVGRLATLFPGRVGHLYSPGGQRGPWDFLPYALDNGAWPAFKNHRPWSEAEWRYLIRWAALNGQRPGWCLVPDVVADRRATLALWDRFSAEVRSFGFRPAFALQDGTTFDDVPDSDAVLFLGGSTEWKENAIGPWCEKFPGRVHVARVNTFQRLWRCHNAGAVSVDGTGWFRRLGGQGADLRRYLEATAPSLSALPSRIGAAAS